MQPQTRTHLIDLCAFGALLLAVFAVGQIPALADGGAAAGGIETTSPRVDPTSQRQALLEHLERTRELFHAEVDGLSAEQWHFKPADDQWSIAEVAEHLAVVEDLVVGRVNEALASETPEEILSQSGGKADQLLAVVLDRSQKFQAPEPVQPAQRWEDPAATVAEFDRLRAQALDLGRESALWNHATEHPVVGPLDVHGWLLFVSGHCERHVAQIAEVKTASGFPAR